jgi:hypothetical protein
MVAVMDGIFASGRWMCSNSEFKDHSNGKKKFLRKNEEFNTRKLNVGKIATGCSDGVRLADGKHPCGHQSIDGSRTFLVVHNGLLEPLGALREVAATSSTTILRLDS